MPRGVSHRQLEAFRAVIEAGTVTVAAERLFITQPAVSRLVQDLEQALELTLFERRAGRLVPTVEAQALYEEVERSFSGLDRIVQAAEDIRTLNRGALRIAAMPALALSFLPRTIKTFSQRHPGVRVSLQVRSSAKVMDWLESQQFDLGFAAVQEVHPAVTQDLLLEAPLMMVMPRGHRLEARRAVEPGDVDGEPFISLGTELDIRSRIDAVFADAGVARALAIDIQLSAAVCRMVAEGAGVALVDPVTAREFADRGELSARAFRPAIAFRYSVLSPVHRSRSLLCEEFLSLVTVELRERLGASGD